MHLFKFSQETFCKDLKIWWKLKTLWWDKGEIQDLCWHMCWQDWGMQCNVIEKPYSDHSRIISNITFKNRHVKNNRASVFHVFTYKYHINGFSLVDSGFKYPQLYQDLGIYPLTLYTYRIYKVHRLFFKVIYQLAPMCNNSLNISSQIIKI